MDDLGSLSHCMTDADVESITRARRLRGKSLLTSLGFEAAVVALLMLWPLFSPAVLGRHTEVLPLAPLRFSRLLIAARTSVSNNSPRAGATITPVFAYHPVNVSHRPSASDDGPPNGDPGLDVGFPSGVPLTTELGSAPLVPPPAAPRTKPPRISIGTMDGSRVHRVQPEYPAIAKAMRLSGIVRLHAIVGVDGTVHELRILSGSPILAAAALDAVKLWQYEPTRLNGQPVEVETYITVNFVLE